MQYYKIVDNGIIVSIGTGNGETEITESEYNEIISVILSCPREEGKIYRLRTDLTWEVSDEPEYPEEG